MVNVTVYLEVEQDYESLARELLELKLAASTSVDIQNTQYRLKDGIVQKKTFNVLTLQTKSLLFRDVCVHIEQRFGPEISIVATPIVSANISFEEQIRSSTKAT